MFDVIYYQAEFKEFKKQASERISSIPAGDRDNFVLVSAKDADRNVGFDCNAEARKIILRFFDICYCISLSGELYAPGEYHGKTIPAFMFKDKYGGFARIVKDHENYVLSMKKYSFLSRHKTLEKPIATRFSAFLHDPTWPINHSLCEDLKEACEFSCIASLAGEYGWGAFTAFAADIDILVNTLAEFSNGNSPMQIKTLSKMPQW